MSTLVVLVFVVAPKSDPTTSAMARSMEDALGGRAHVVLRTVESLPADTAALQLSRDADADAVAEVRWLDAHRQEASVHMHVADEPSWIDRRVGFTAADAPAERGRTIGFTIASMMPEPSAATEPAPPATPLPPAAPPPSTPPAAASAASGAPPTPTPAPTPRPPPEREPVGAVELSLVDAWNPDGTASSLGASLAGEGRLSPSWSARLSLGWRTGDLAPAQARALVLSMAPEIAWRPIDPSRERPFGFGLRAGYAVLRQQLTRAVDGAMPPAQWQSAARATIEGSWLFAPGALAVVALGGEATFGTLSVVVGGKTVSSIAPLRTLGELGIRARF